MPGPVVGDWSTRRVNDVCVDGARGLDGCCTSCHPRDLKACRPGSHHNEEAPAIRRAHVHGREAVRDYWTRQWALVNPRVDPVSFETAADASVIVKVQQSIRDLEGRPLQDQAHGLKDKLVGHVFQFRKDKVARFDIQDF